MSNLFKPVRFLAMTAMTAAKLAHASGTIASRLAMSFKLILVFVLLYGDANASGSITIRSSIGANASYIYNGGVNSTTEFSSMSEAGAAECKWSGARNGYPLFSRADFVGNSGAVDTYTCWCQNDAGDEDAIANVYRVKKYNCYSLTDPHMYDGYAALSGWNCNLSNAALVVPNSSLTGLQTTGTCNDFYVPNADATKCVPDRYTVVLSGLGGADVMPKATRDAYAEVKTSSGSPKSGINVDLFLDVVPELEGQLPVTYTGTLTPDSGPTDWEGKLHFVFKAPEAGGTHTITAKCTNCAKEVTGTIKVPGCKTKDIREVDDIPPNGPDVLPLTQVLERTWGAGLALLPAAQAGLDCVKAKLPGVKISGGTRTVAYQAHLKEVWDKLIELDELEDPVQIRACKPLRDKIKAHNSCGGNGHCITYEPAEDSDHPRGDAFDISGIEVLLGKLRPPPDLQLPPRPPLTPAQERQADVRLIADWLAVPPTCNLVWGGSYGDRVHFSIP